jgi:hypothetical protein
MALGIGRDLIYDEIRTGRLRSKKAGTRRIIGRHHLLEWLDGGHLEGHRRASELSLFSAVARQSRHAGSARSTSGAWRLRGRPEIVLPRRRLVTLIMTITQCHD